MRALLVGAFLFLALTAPAAGQDADAPEDAPAYWLPHELWVTEHWLPYDEERLFRLLAATRTELWLYLRDDRRTLAAFARSRGWRAGRLADALIAPWREKVPAARLRLLRRRTLRTLTQGHLAQHMLFHSLHQQTLPLRAPRIFGTRTPGQFRRLRRAQLSPFQIAALNGRPSGLVYREVVAALRATARRGARARAMTARQANLLLGRQLRFVPRWLRRAWTNTRRGRVVVRRHDYADAPVLTADGRSTVYEAYDRGLDLRRRPNAFSFYWRDLAAPVARPIRVQRSLAAHDIAVSGDGSHVAYEATGEHVQGAHRHGGPMVLVQEVASGRAEAIAGDKLTVTYAPSLSDDGSRVAFESSRPAAADGTGELTQTFVRDFRAGATTLASRGDGVAGAPPDAAVLGSQLSGDGRVVAFATAAPNLGAATAAGRRAAVFLRYLDERRTLVVSAGAGDASAPSISHDGRVLAFVSTRNRAACIAVRHGATRSIGRLGPCPAWSPVVSADGGTVAFVAGRRPGVWVADVATGRSQRISPPGRWAVEPALSADGRIVAFAAEDRRHARAVYVYDRATGSLHGVAGGPG